MNVVDIGGRVQKFGTGMLRYGLVAILLMIGATKWTPAEAEAIRPWVTHSPFLSWIYSVTSNPSGIRDHRNHRDPCGFADRITTLASQGDGHRQSGGGGHVLDHAGVFS